MVEIYSAPAIIPMFLLLAALKAHLPEKSGVFAAGAATANAKNTATITTAAILHVI
jgi:hypothetical protein